jgi:hypothetical protein
MIGAPVARHPGHTVIHPAIQGICDFRIAALRRKLVH